MALLTDKQEAFCKAFVLGGVASDAYKEAYPTSLTWRNNTVYVRASEMLRKGKIMDRIEELRKHLMVKFDVSAERLVQEQASIALFDFRNLFDENGNLLNPKDFPPHVAAAVSSVKVSRVFQKGEKEGDEPFVEQITEVKLWNKNNSIDSLFKHKGLYEQDNKQRGAGDIADAIKEMASRIDGKSKGPPNAGS